MANIIVPDEERPSIWKHVALTLGRFLLVGGVIANVQLSGSPGLRTVVTLLGAIANLAILFIVIQSLIEGWFNAAVITDPE